MARRQELQDRVTPDEAAPARYQYRAHGRTPLAWFDGTRAV
jgi:hypothetical protein